MRFRRVVFALFFLFFSIRLWGISFPQVALFPVKVGYSFTLFSETGNRIEFSELLQLPEDIQSGIWVLWKCNFFIADKKEEYILTLWINYDGEVYLYSLKDRVYERGFDNIPLVFSSGIEYNKPISLGEKISLIYIAEYNNFIHSKTKIRLGGVIKAKLNIGNNQYLLYFVKDNGLYIIETPDEIFVKK